MHHFLNQKPKIPFSHIEKYEIILHNRFSRTIEIALHVLPRQKRFQKEFFNPNNKKGFLKHSMSSIDIFLS